MKRATPDKVAKLTGRFDGAIRRPFAAVDVDKARNSASSLAVAEDYRSRVSSGSMRVPPSVYTDGRRFK